MKKAVTAFFMAWGMFCAIPCPLKIWDASAKKQMLLCFPLVGLLTGAIWSLAAYLLSLAGGLGLFGAMVMAALPYLLTGFIHLDGFMDCCDAILSRRDLQERRRILKDSHVGSFAVVCLALLLLFSFSLASGLDLGRLGLKLMFVSASARCVPVLAIALLPPMPGSSYDGLFQGKKGGFIAFAAALFVLAAGLPALFYGLSGLCALAAGLGGALAILRGYGSLRGMSGDIAGLALTFGELCGVACAVFLK